MSEKYILTEYIEVKSLSDNQIHLPEIPIIAKPELSAKALNGEANCDIIQQITLKIKYKRGYHNVWND